MTIEERKRRVRIHKYCTNCLARSHATEDCISADVCQKCGWAHHTLLHMPNRVSTSTQPNQRSRAYSQTSRNARTSSRPARVERRNRRANVHQRIGHYSQLARPRRTESRDRTRRRTDDAARNPKTILRKVQRALQRLAETI